MMAKVYNLKTNDEGHWLLRDENGYIQYGIEYLVAFSSYRELEAERDRLKQANEDLKQRVRDAEFIFMFNEKIKDYKAKYIDFKSNSE